MHFAEIIIPEKIEPVYISFNRVVFLCQTNNTLAKSVLAGVLL